MRDRQSSTVFDDNGGGEGAGRMKVTGTGSHVISSPCVEEPLRSVGRVCDDAGGVKRRVQGLVIPGMVGRR
jgi:hypothetical protein